MADEESDKIRRIARNALNRVTFHNDKALKMIGAKNMKDFDQHVTMLSLNDSPNAWRTAGPITQIADTPYPFNKNRPTAKEIDDAYKIAVGILLHPINREYKTELEAYTMQMFGESREKHQAMKAAVLRSKMPKDFKLHIDLLNGKDMVPKDANGLSDPYCYISVIKGEHSEMISHSKHNLEGINKSKKLGLTIKKSKIIVKTLNPTWNQSFELSLRKNGGIDLIVVEVWDSDKDPVHLREVGITRITKFFRDGSDDDFMGRGFLPISDVTFMKRHHTLTLYSRRRKKEYGTVRIQVSLTGDKPVVDTDMMLKEHSQLTAAILDFESHMTGEYLAEWNAMVTPLGSKFISLHAAMNGLSPLQQAAVLFPLLLRYDEKISLSIISYFGVVKAIISNQEELSSSPPDLVHVQTIINCLNYLDAILIGLLRKQNQLFDLQTDAGVKYLSLHVALVKEMYTIKLHVQRLDHSRKSLKDTLYNTLATACEEWLNMLIAAAVPSSTPDKKQAMLGFVEVISFVIEKLHNSTGTIQNIFKSVGVDYYTLLYITVDKQIASAVQSLTAGYKKGDIPSYQLYLHVGDILKLSVNVSRQYKQQLQLKDYHKWFTCLVCGWIDAAAQKCTDEIKRAVTALDNVVTVTKNVKYSQSALNAVSCFARVKAFWNHLQWPSVVERYSFIAVIVNGISMSAEYYVEESHKHLISNGFCDNPDCKEFEITQPLCICLNDIDHVREEILKIPVALEFDTLIERLSEVEGDEMAANARRTLTNLIEAANDNVMACFNDLVNSIGEKMSTHIKTHVKTLIKADPDAQLYEALDPLMLYLCKGMQTFNSFLSKAVLDVVLKEIWITIYKIFKEASEDPKLEQMIGKRLLLSLKELEKFFNAKGNGLALEKIKFDKYLMLRDMLDAKASTDDELIEQHLKTLAKWTENNTNENGLLSFSIGYIQDKQILEITVIQAKNLPAMDSNGFSDPFVEILLMPEERFKMKPIRTTYKCKELNPFYAADFKINVKEDLIDMSGSCLSFTVLDHDRFTKNDYCGMVVLSCEDIPRLPNGFSGIDDANTPQRKTYELPLLLGTMTPALMELSRRDHHYVKDFNRWHSIGTSFIENIASRVSSMPRNFEYKY